MSKDKQDCKRMQIILSYMSLPFVLGIPPIVGWYIGSWLDRYFGTMPYGMYILLILGIGSGGRELYHIITKHKDEEI